MFGRDKPLKASKREAYSKISIPLRALADDQVDRRRVYAWQHVQLSRTNRPFVLSISIRPAGRTSSISLVLLFSVTR